jgi:DnaJ-class molecular chaperone
MSERLYQGKTGSEWIANGNKPGTCRRCDGCGQLANDDDKSAWWMWKTLPLGSDLAVQMGLIHPDTCPDCNGTGRAPK